MTSGATPRTGWFTWLGLFLAFLGPVFIAGPPALLAGAPNSPAAAFVFLCGLWAVAILLGLVVTGPERAPLSSIGLERPTLRTIGLGIGGAVVTLGVLTLVLTIFDGSQADIGRGVEVLGAWPLWLKVLTVITAGVVEEILYRGYAITRLAMLIGNRWIAATISLAVFTISHVPFWGLEAAVAILLGGVVLTGLFLWTRTLVPGMIAHTLVDAFSLLIQPLLD